MRLLRDNGKPCNWTRLCYAAGLFRRSVDEELPCSAHWHCVTAAPSGSRSSSPVQCFPNELQIAFTHELTLAILRINPRGDLVDGVQDLDGVPDLHDREAREGRDFLLRQPAGSVKDLWHSAFSHFLLVAVGLGTAVSGKYTTSFTVRQTADLCLLS